MTDTFPPDPSGRQPDPEFFQRADAHINLSNDQLATVSRGEVNASMMFGMARFNAWMAASTYGSSELLAARRQETLNYFVNQFRIMLEDNLDDYIRNFESFMTASQPDAT
jgi:Protein of unknown function (DUF3144)